MNNLNILIVEDESLVALELSMSIKEQGYNVVDYVTSSQEAIEAMQNDSINLIIMDINLEEDIDGIDLYRSFHTSASVIYLTAYKDEKTISKAVLTEPVGYLIKPHNDKELVALLKLSEIKLERTMHEKQKEIVYISPEFYFNKQENRLYKNGEYVKLSAKKSQLLQLLIEAKGEAVSFETIEYELWPDKVPSSSSIRTLIYRLRNELGSTLIENELNYGVKLKIRE